MYRDDLREDDTRRREFRRRARRFNEGLPVGLILLLVGGILLAKQFGVFFPGWLISWEALVILVGLVILIKRKFRSIGAVIMIGVGAFFLLDDYYPALRDFIWPAVIILVGLLIIFKPNCKKKSMFRNGKQGPDATAEQAYSTTQPEATPLKGDVLDVASVFGSTRKVVISKNFKGGEIVSVFAGSEINLSQADFTGPVKIEAVAVFGGMKLIVPSNWEIRSETAVVVGGIEDKREPVAVTHPEKVIILEGVVIFGGIEINSY